MAVSRLRLIGTLLLVAGVPIVIMLVGFSQEIRHLGILGARNPLPDVAASLMERVDKQVRDAHRALELVVADQELAAGAATLARYGPFVEQGPFLALARVAADGTRQTIPNRIPTPWAQPLRPPVSGGISELISLPDGQLVLTLAVAGSEAGPPWAVGLFDVRRVLGKTLLQRMRATVWGDAFLADGDGRIFLSANPRFVGRSLTDLGWSGTDSATPWTDEVGRDHWVALASGRDYMVGPQSRWRAGLTVPVEVVSGRSSHLSRRLVAIMAAVIICSVFMLLVLRRSVRGRAK